MPNERDPNLPDFARVAASMDDTSPEPSENFEKAKGAGDEVARLLWAYRESLKAVGFEGAEAFELVCVYQSFLLDNIGAMEEDD